MKPPSEAQPGFQHRCLPLISGSAVIWVSRHLCGYLVRTQCQNLPFCLEKTWHEVSQLAEGYQGEGEEGFELEEWTRLMEDKDGQHGKHSGQSSLVLAQNPSTAASNGTGAADRASLCVFIFFGSQFTKGWAALAWAQTQICRCLWMDLREHCPKPSQACCSSRLNELPCVWVFA